MSLKCNLITALTANSEYIYLYNLSIELFTVAFTDFVHVRNWTVNQKHKQTYEEKKNLELDDYLSPWGDHSNFDWWRDFFFFSINIVWTYAAGPWTDIENLLSTRMVLIREEIAIQIDYYSAANQRQ